MFVIKGVAAVASQRWTDCIQLNAHFVSLYFCIFSRRSPRPILARNLPDWSTKICKPTTQLYCRPWLADDGQRRVTALLRDTPARSTSLLLQEGRGFVEFIVYNFF
ncbi:hypothetical protein D7M10_09115 [Pseudomonas fluorescens]|nr:hypothetical protein D7M10_09115 [Pseudomonas fluorescens]